jgi:uracil-DNA glycosylase family 4
MTISMMRPAPFSLQLKTVSDCSRCNLKEMCNNVVAGYGEGNKKIFFVAENPESGEDIEGTPFIDRGGYFFRYLLTKYNINNFWLTYAVKCKSSKILKRNIQTCKDWLIEEIKEYKPRVLCSLGVIPTKLFLKFSSIGDVAGKTYRVPELNFQLCPYYSLNYIASKGKIFQEQTSAWLKIVKEIAEC